MSGDRPSGKTKLASFVAMSVTDEDGNLIAVGGEWQDAYGTPIDDQRTIQRLEEQYPPIAFERGERVDIDPHNDGNRQDATVVVYHGAGTWVVQTDSGRIGVPYDRMFPKD